MGKYLLAHDIGTSGNKATLFAVEGKLIKSTHAGYDVSYGEGGMQFALVRKKSWKGFPRKTFWQFLFRHKCSAVLWWIVKDRFLDLQ